MTTKPTKGACYTSTRRDYVHGSLTFYVEVKGVRANGVVLATQYAIGYSNGSMRPSKPVDLEICNFAHYLPAY